jgi:serine/threonine-protein phosphatase 2B regulatory subunit
VDVSEILFVNFNLCACFFSCFTPFLYCSLEFVSSIYRFTQVTCPFCIFLTCHHLLPLLVTHGELKKIEKRFRLIDVNDNGYIALESLLQIPELSTNPLSFRVAQLLNPGTPKGRGPNHKINLHLFVMILSLFSPTQVLLFKKAQAFRLYDVDGDGIISAEDLFRTLKAMVGSARTDAALMATAKSTIARVDPNGKRGGMAYKDFAKAIDITAIFDCDDKPIFD